jgi:hypothetical protein
VRVLPIAKASTSRRATPKSVKQRFAEAFATITSMASGSAPRYASAEEQRALVARRDRELASLRNNAPQRRRASIAERAPASQRNNRALTIVPSERS